MPLSQRALAVGTLTLAVPALVLACAAGKSCAFLKVRDDVDNIFAHDEDHVVKLIGLACSSPADLTGHRWENGDDTWFQTAYYFWLVALVSAATTVLYALSLATCLPTSKPMWRWRLLVLLSSCSVVLCAPTFAIYGAAVCETTSSCTPGIGTYLMISAIALWIALTVAALYLGQANFGRCWIRISDDGSIHAERDKTAGQASHDSTFLISDDDEVATDDARGDAEAARDLANAKQCDYRGKEVKASTKPAARTRSPPIVLPPANHEGDDFLGLLRMGKTSMDDDVDGGHETGVPATHVTDEEVDSIFGDLESDEGASVSSPKKNASDPNLAVPGKKKAAIDSSSYDALPPVQSFSIRNTSNVSSLTSHSQAEMRRMRRRSLMDQDKQPPKSTSSMLDVTSKIFQCFVKDPRLIMYDGVGYGDGDFDEVD